MRMLKPTRYEMQFDENRFSVTCPDGTPHFSGCAASYAPKLYVVVIDGKPVYVGITKQPMRDRLRYGFTANGRHGYHGYAWRRGNKTATLTVWCQAATGDGALRDIETVEAEVVFLCRQAGQWPRFQTEIHFHPSTRRHRQIAAAIWRSSSTIR